MLSIFSLRKYLVKVIVKMSKASLTKQIIVQRWIKGNLITIGKSFEICGFGENWSSWS